MPAAKVSKSVYLVKPGEAVYRDNRVVFASSSVVLVEDDDKLLLVDTGLWTDCDKLLQGLEELGLSSSEIDAVVLTHLHGDHCGCLDLFNCPKYAHPSEIARALSLGYDLSCRPVPRKFSDKLWVLDTPGHVYGHVSVVFEGEEVVVAAGDAIPIADNLLKHIPPLIRVDAEMALKSMERIAEVADVVVPGHDKPFRIRGLKRKPKIR